MNKKNKSHIRILKNSQILFINKPSKIFKNNKFQRNNRNINKIKNPKMENPKIINMTILISVFKIS